MDDPLADSGPPLRPSQARMALPGAPVTQHPLRWGRGDGEGEASPH